MTGFLGCKRTLPAHVQIFIHQYPQVLLCRAALNPFIPQSVLILGIALTQVQDLVLGLVELHEVHMGPLLKPVKIPLDGSPSLYCTTQLGVIYKLAEVALNPTISNCALAFLIPSLHIQAESLYSSQDTCPCFHCLCISFLHFSLTKRSLLSHAGLLPSLPDFLHMGIESSCVLRKMSLKSCQLCSAPLSLRAGPDSTLHLARSSQGCEFHQGMITAAQAATNLDLSNKLICVAHGPCTYSEVIHVLPMLCQVPKKLGWDTARIVDPN
ncbi:LOW QUALITY PROTEIN: hypothetical protein QYF61_012640 [Mycteria americana]|uniref:Uncharacterized protein n=1 Tax=Mycteria americana TaxID=33587 RepID=A0AAN7MJ46_MYCAM|nr:LOW QUALITY PROTEIN: hypothetical protein QYF61_012640 [Mycteria americana]